MSPLTVRLARSAVLAFALGLLLGVWFAFDRAVGAMARPLHAELNLWGGVTLLIYGLAFHMLPRFSGKPLPRPRLAEAQSYAALAGVALAALGWLAQLWRPALAMPLLALGGTLQLAAALLFIALVAPLFIKENRHVHA